METQSDPDKNKYNYHLFTWQWKNNGTRVVIREVIERDVMECNTEHKAKQIVKQMNEDLERSGQLSY